MLTSVTTNKPKWPAEHARRVGDNGFALHQWVHHGLSSQAMVFNLVGLLIVRGDLAPLQVAMERAGIAWPAESARAGFEYSDCAMFNEDEPYAITCGTA